MNDLISVIVPVYNIEKELLDKCINSIINQSYRNLEIIIVDDGSAKETENECKRLSKLDSRVRLIRQTNQGSSIARQTGIINSNGSYLCFMDHDDFMDEDMVEKLHNEIVINDADIGVCGVKYVYDSGRIENRNFYRERALFNKEEAYLELMKDKEMFSVLWNKMFKKTLFDGIEFPKNSLFDDCHVICRVFYKANKTVICPEHLHNYYQFEKSVIHNVTIDRFLDRFDALRDRWEFTCQYMPQFSSVAAEAMVKYSIKYLLNYKNGKGLSKEEYKNKTKAVFDIIEKDEVRIVAKSMEKYSKDYEYLLKHKYDNLGKILYYLKNRVSK